MEAHQKPGTPDSPCSTPASQPPQHQQNGVEVQTSPNPLFVIQPSPFVPHSPLVNKHKLPGAENGALTQVHVQALDEIVSVNSFFTVAVFIGLSFTNPTVDGNLVGECYVGANYTKYLLIFEVAAFSSYLLSSLIAQGLKLLIVIVNSKDHPQAFSARIHPKTLRYGMLFTAVGTTIGTVCLTLSICLLVQIRLGLLNCDSPWSRWAAIPMVVMVSSGLLSFMCAALYAFCT